MCHELGIDLIIIEKINETKNKWDSQIIFNHVLQYVKNYYLNNNKKIPILNMLNFKADLSKNSHAFKKLQEIKFIAEKNKGKILCSVWKGAKNLHTFQFEDGRAFHVSPDSLKRQGWPQDPDRYFKTDEDRYIEFKSFIEKNNGILLNKKWQGVKTKYKIKIASGEIHLVRPDHLINGVWPKAGDFKLKNTKILLNELKKIATKNKGKLLSTQWTTGRDKYEFEFKDGRKFKITAEKLKSRGWPKSPDFYINRVRTDEDRLNELKDIANKNNGKLLDTQWIPSRHKYKFEFEDGRFFSKCYADMVNLGWPKNLDSYFRRVSGIAKSKTSY